MKITPTQEFLHGEDRFHPGTEYEVEDALGGYFVGNGWATSDGWSSVITVTTPPAEVDLRPDDAVQGTDSQTLEA